MIGSRTRMGSKNGRDRLFEVFGDDPFRPDDRRFEIRNRWVFHPKMYWKVAWAKRVVNMWLEGMKIDRVPIYPKEPVPPLRRESQVRGGQARSRNRRRRKDVCSSK